MFLMLFLFCKYSNRLCNSSLLLFCNDFLFNDLSSLFSKAMLRNPITIPTPRFCKPRALNHRIRVFLPLSYNSHSGSLPSLSKGVWVLFGFAWLSLAKENWTQILLKQTDGKKKKTINLSHENKSKEIYKRKTEQ